MTKGKIFIKFLHIFVVSFFIASCDINKYEIRCQ